MIKLEFERKIASTADGLYVRIPKHLVEQYELEKGDYVVVNLKVLKEIDEEVVP